MMVLLEHITTSKMAASLNFKIQKGRERNLGKGHLPITYAHLLSKTNPRGISNNQMMGESKISIREGFPTTTVSLPVFYLGFPLIFLQTLLIFKYQSIENFILHDISPRTTTTYEVYSPRDHIASPRPLKATYNIPSITEGWSSSRDMGNAK